MLVPVQCPFKTGKTKIAIFLVDQKMFEPCRNPSAIVQGDPDLEIFQSLYFSLSRKYTFRPRSKPSDMPTRIYITICTPPPHLSPLPYCPQNRGESEH
jgi:hypothetical protein